MTQVKQRKGWRMSRSNLSVTSLTSQLILQPFRRFTYVTAHSPTHPLLHLRHSSFSNTSFASPMSQALHLIHLASRPCKCSIYTVNRVPTPLYTILRRTRIRSPVGSILWLWFFRGFPSTLRQMSGNLGHNRPRLSYDHRRPLSSKPYIIRLRMATVSDLSLVHARRKITNNKQQQQQHVTRRPRREQSWQNEALHAQCICLLLECRITAPPNKTVPVLVVYLCLNKNTSLELSSRN